MVKKILNLFTIIMTVFVPIEVSLAGVGSGVGRLISLSRESTFRAFRRETVYGTNSSRRLLSR
ncbi:MAG: hypothetical protein AAF202_06770, partial [Pseudomonadota bacterium]